MRLRSVSYEDFLQQKGTVQASFRQQYKLQIGNVHAPAEFWQGSG